MDEAKLTFFEDTTKTMKKSDSFISPYFAICIRDKKSKKDVFKQVSDLTSCRESLISNIKSSILGISTPYRQNVKKRGVDRTVVMYYIKQIEKNSAKKTEIKNKIEAALENAKGIMNFFEKAGQLKLSKVYRAVHDLPNSHMIYVFEGSGEWMRAPYMFSLYTLLIRCGRFLDLGEFKTDRQFVRKCKKLLKEHEKLRSGDSIGFSAKFASVPSGMNNDVHHINQVSDKIMMLMENRKKLFSPKKMTELYKSCSNVDGISRLCDGNINDNTMTNKFVEICDQQEVKSKKPRLR